MEFEQAKMDVLVVAVIAVKLLTATLANSCYKHQEASDPRILLHKCLCDVPTMSCLLVFEYTGLHFLVHTVHAFIQKLIQLCYSQVSLYGLALPSFLFLIKGKLVLEIKSG